MAHFLVQYGLGAWLGQFVAEAETHFPRGGRVVVHTSRGTEIGTVMDAVEERHAHLLADSPGRIIRPVTLSDEADECVRRERLNQILDAAQWEAETRSLPLLFLDGEILFDGSRAILQAVHHAECDANPLFEELTERFGLPVMLHDLTSAPKPTNGCGKPGCGSEGGGCSSCGSEGGCSSGSCSKGKVKSPQELTHYFSQLREQMEAARDRIPLS